MDVPAAANVLGTLGAVCWSVQIVVNYRRHHAIGLQSSMMMLWAWAGVPLGVYNIVEDFNIALRIQPQILTFLSLITWAQCYYYQRRWSVKRCLLAAAPIVIVMGSVQAALIVGLGILKSRQVEWPMTLMAVLSALLLAAGVLRHYWDIWIHRTVRGVSFLFVGIDAAGDVFSLVSVLFQPKLDILGMAIYGTELLLWLGVFACGGYFNLLPRVQRYLSKRRSRRSGPTSSPHEADGGVTLHESPSSTSVFRTASRESATQGRRMTSLRRSNYGTDGAGAGVE